MQVTVYNVTRGPVRLIGRVLPRWSSTVVDTINLTQQQLAELGRLEAYDTVRCTPSLLPKPTPQGLEPKPAAVLTLVAEPEKDGLMDDTWWEPKKDPAVPPRPTRRKRGGA
jgi:hypothetical protein